MKRLIGAAALLMVFGACTKTDKDESEPVAVEKYLKSSASPTDTLIYNYDAEYRLTDYHFTPTTGDEYNYKLVYTQDKLTELVLENLSTGDRFTKSSYDYDNQGRLLRVHSFIKVNEDITQHYYDSLVYDNNNVTVGSYRARVLNEPRTYSSRTILIRDTKGNITRKIEVDVVKNVETKDSTVYSYTYDDKINMRRNVKAHQIMAGYNPSLRPSQNNTLTVEMVINGKVFVKANYTYTYDKDGYPITQKSSYLTITNGQEERTEDTADLQYITKE